MKWVLNILGVILALVGILWILQGANVLPGSFMSGNMMWAYIGIVLDAAAAVLFYFANFNVKRKT